MGDRLIHMLINAPNGLKAELVGKVGFDPVVFSGELFCTGHQRYMATSTGIYDCPPKDSASTRQTEARDATKYPAMHRMVPTAKKKPALNAHRAERW